MCIEEVIKNKERESSCGEQVASTRIEALGKTMMENT